MRWGTNIGILFLAASLTAEGAPAEGPPLDRVVIVLREGVSRSAAAELAASALNGQIVYEVPEQRYFVIRTPAATYPKLVETIHKAQADSRVLRATTGAFSDPVDEKDIRNEGGEQYAVNEVLVTLKPDAGLDLALALADELRSKIVGFTASINLYRLRIASQSRDELEQTITQLRADSRVARVSRNTVFPFERQR